MSNYRLGSCLIFSDRRELSRDGQPVRLSRRAFDALILLLEKYPNALSKTELYTRLWPETIVELGNINNVIAEIRSAIGDTRKTMVVTKHRFGYRIAAPVSLLDDRHEARPARFALSIAGRTHWLAEGDHTVGRSPAVEVVIDLPSVSRHHAVIRVAGERVELEDLGSKNGTLVGKKRIHGPHPLSDRATICFGAVCGVFRALTSGTTVTETIGSEST